MSQVRVRQRRGATLAAALVCLVIVTALLGHMLVGALRMGRQMRVDRDRRQCELLLQAGLDRAAFQLAAAETYSGETWNITPDEIGGFGEGQVTIQVSRAGDAPPHIHVLAEYPLGSEHSIRRSRSVELQSTHPLPQE
jgi:Tfp pilus assembly protein PilX